MRESQLDPVSLLHIFEDAGGIFAVLVFIHLIADFAFQGYDVAQSTYLRVRGLITHSVMYATQFIPVLLFLRLNMLQIFVGFTWLAVSHFIIDSTYLTDYWVRRIHKNSEIVKNPRVLYELYASYHNSIRILILDHIQHGLALWVLIALIMY